MLFNTAPPTKQQKRNRMSYRAFKISIWSQESIRQQKN